MKMEVAMEMLGTAKDKIQHDDGGGDGDGDIEPAICPSYILTAAYSPA